MRIKVPVSLGRSDSSPTKKINAAEGGHEEADENVFIFPRIPDERRTVQRLPNAYQLHHTRYAQHKKAHPNIPYKPFSANDVVLPDPMEWDAATPVPGHAFSSDDGAFFCYLMKQLGGQCKNEANIKTSIEPYKDVCGHNRGDVNDKSTKPARGLWQVEIIAGPFDTLAEATIFREEWLGSSRGMNSRRLEGIRLTVEWRANGFSKLMCFDKRLVPHPLNAYLAEVNLDFLQVDARSYDALVESLDERRNPTRRKGVVQNAQIAFTDEGPHQHRGLKKEKPNTVFTSPKSSVPYSQQLIR